MSCAFWSYANSVARLQVNQVNPCAFYVVIGNIKRTQQRAGLPCLLQAFCRWTFQACIHTSGYCRTFDDMPARHSAGTGTGSQIEQDSRSTSVHRFPDCCNIFKSKLKALCVHAYVWMVHVRCKFCDKSPEDSRICSGLDICKMLMQALSAAILADSVAEPQSLL